MASGSKLSGVGFQDSGFEIRDSGFGKGIWDSEFGIRVESCGLYQWGEVGDEVNKVVAELPEAAPHREPVEGER